MLSYQHIYHAGCLSDIHKHAVLCTVLATLVQKPASLTYMETHSGRGIYNLQSVEAQKTQEARQGIVQMDKDRNWFTRDHPFVTALAAIRGRYEAGQQVYPGSPLLAEYFLRPEDKLHLMELHPQEVEHLYATMGEFPNAKVYAEDGYHEVMMQSPPNPRRGLVMIDPSYEIKSEYGDMAAYVTKLQHKWPVATIIVWYPMLESDLHMPMVAALQREVLPDTWHQEVTFFPKGTQRGMYGSGVFIVNVPRQARAGLDAIAPVLNGIAIENV